MYNITSMIQKVPKRWERLICFDSLSSRNSENSPMIKNVPKRRVRLFSLFWWFIFSRWQFSMKSTIVITLFKMKMLNVCWQDINYFILKYTFVHVIVLIQNFGSLVILMATNSLRWIYHIKHCFIPLWKIYLVYQWPTWASCCLKSLETWICPTAWKKTPELHINDPLWGESTGFDHRIFLANSQ